MATIKNQVTILSGLGWPLTMGGTKALEHFIDLLPPEAESTHWPHFAWEKAAQEIIALHKKAPKIPIMVIGFSMGVYDGIRLINVLKERGIKVKYFAAIDPTALGGNMTPMVVPSNVENVDEFWSQKRFLNFPEWARNRAPDGSKGGKLTIPEGMKRELIEVDTGHIGTVRHPDVINRVIFQVARWLGVNVP